MNTINRLHIPFSSNNNNSPKLLLEASIDGKLNSIEIPQYALRFANFDRVSLPAVKHGIYHPKLASMYKYQIDDFLSKFTIENARTSTKLNANAFKQHKDNLQKESHSRPLGLKGDVNSAEETIAIENRGRATAFKFHDEFVNKQPMRRSVSCISGKEECEKYLRDKTKQSFRFNRVRDTLSDVPTHGKMQSYFDAKPSIDLKGRKVEAASASVALYRERNPTDRLQTPFKPYGYTSAKYQNYIMGYPRL